MRSTTILAVALTAASTAAIAQVASTPVEQKVPSAGQQAGDNLMSNDTDGDETTSNVSDAPVANAAEGTPPGDTPPDPVAASSAPPK